MLNVAYVIVAAQCTLIAAAGYAMYGAGALDVITFNLPRGLLATLCASLILVNPIAKFALTVDTPATAADAAIAARAPGAPRGRAVWGSGHVSGWLLRPPERRCLTRELSGPCCSTVRPMQ